MNILDLSKFLILIPAYNEEAVVGSVISGLHKKGFSQILVVDDGSTDDTSKAAHDAGAIVVTHASNLGYGASTRTGFSYAQIFSSCDYVITTDADGQHSPEDVLRIAEYAFSRKLQYVIGTRNFSASREFYISVQKNIIHFMADLLLYVLSGHYVKDTHSGLRCLHKAVLKKLNTKTMGFSFSTEIVLEAVRNHIKIDYLPIEIIYSKYSMSKPARSKFTNSLRLIMELLS